MTIPLGSTVTVQTPAGPLAGRVVGTEQRDNSRHGTGTPVPFVCLAVADPSNEWRWVPASEVTP